MKMKLMFAVLAVTAILSSGRAQAQNSPNEQNTSRETSSELFPAPARLESSENYRPSVGVRAGVINAEGSYRSAPEFGLDLSFQPFIPFGLGLTVSTSRSQSQREGADLERTSALVRGAYNFGGSTMVVKNSWIGVAAGPVFRRDGTDLGIAPIIGFDIPVSEGSGAYFSFGADAKYLTLINSNDSDALSVDGVVKLWF